MTRPSGTPLARSWASCWPSRIDGEVCLGRRLGHGAIGHARRPRKRRRSARNPASDPDRPREDLPKLRWLLREPGAEFIAAFRERVQRQKRFAADRGILVEGWGGCGGDLALYVCGGNLLYLVQDDPQFGHELMDMSYDIDLKCMEIILDEGVDVVYARGCYETAPLWSPRWFDELFAPRIARKAGLAHQAGASFSYFSSGNFLPHLESLLAADVDILNCVRPFPPDVNDMRLLKRRVGDRMCLWGGVNPEEDIERGTPAHIRRTVADVILAAAGGGGLVLSPGGSLYDPDRYDQVMTFIQAALEFGRYPIDTTLLAAQLQQTGDNLC